MKTRADFQHAGDATVQGYLIAGRSDDLRQDLEKRDLPRSIITSRIPNWMSNANTKVNITVVNSGG